MSKQLLDNGYERLAPNQVWSLEDGGRYFTIVDQSSLIAFRINNSATSFRIVATHNDSPGFKIKPNGLLEQRNYLLLNTEVYGSPIYSTWFDRLLKMAGRLFVKDKEGVRSELVIAKLFEVLIPNLAIHFNREINDGIKLNPQIDLLPLVSSNDYNQSWSQWLAKTFGKKENEILAHDLFLYNPEDPQLWNNGKYFSAPRIDNLECTYATLVGFLLAKSSSAIDVFVSFNNEEIGSLTKQGAASSFLRDTLERISLALGKRAQEHQCMLANSYIISADNAHAQHPNRAEKTDPVNYTVMNGGIVIKHSARQSYTTDAMSSSLFMNICQNAGIPYQNLTNRSDERGGGTLGAISSSQVSIASIDIGLPQLAMHSAFETAGTDDFVYLLSAIKLFFESSFQRIENGWKF